MALRHWLQLSLAGGIGPILIGRIIDAAGSAEAACAADLNLLRNIEGIGAARADRIAAGLREAANEVDGEIAKAAAAGARILCREDDEYPPLLRHIPDPPAVLYVRGELLPRDLHAVAIVGSRRCSFYGREHGERFAALLAGAGVTITSGGARGIDSAAHRGALSHANGRTIAVLGSGIDVIYPPENAALFGQIAAGRGAVLSEMPMGTAPRPELFPRRNRVVSGVSRGVFVVEADEKSGALITARQAIDDHNRIVFALPGRVDNVMSAGTHKLIKEGAALVRSVEDILDELGPMPDDIARPPATQASAKPLFGGAEVKPPAPAAAVPLTERQAALLGHIDHQPISVDVLIDRSGLPANIVLQELTLLTLRGGVRRVDGQTFVRR